MRSLSLGARMLIASAVLALLVAGVFAILIQAVASLNDATDREAHAKDVTAATLRLEKLVLDLETGVRGFILTGNENVLKPWKEARAELNGQI
ncbi:MAG: CHASE3 domain-containing protein, partial [Gaiellaceae bacterium]